MTKLNKPWALVRSRFHFILVTSVKSSHNLPNPSVFIVSDHRRTVNLQKQNRPPAYTEGPFLSISIPPVLLSRRSASRSSARDSTIRSGGVGAVSASFRDASPVNTRMDVTGVPCASAISVYRRSPITASSSGRKPVCSRMKSRVWRAGFPKNSGTAPVDASITLAREPQSGIQPPFSTGQFQSGLTP